MQILDGWLKDLPQQYLGQPNIEVLVSAFARQLQEVYQAFADVNDLTNLETATGKNLDYVGSILSLTRKEAGALAGSGRDEPVMSDDRYRQYLKFQLLKNTNECTYYDLIDGAKLLWNVSPVLYVEDENYPATIILQIPLTKEDGTPATIGEVPIIKPAGVSILYQYRFGGVIEVSERMEKFAYQPPLCGQHRCGTYPYTATLGKSAKNTVEVIARIDGFLTTPRFCGTHPIAATLGKSAQNEVALDSVIEGIIYESNAVGQTKCGTVPTEATAGLSLGESKVTMGQNTAGIKYTPTFCNTKHCGQEVKK